MKKKMIVAFTASISYFIIYIIIKFYLQNAVIDWQSALLGASGFWVFIFAVHHFLSMEKTIPN